jgi:hypothetical protein
MRVAYAKRAARRCIAGSPARQRGNFLLRGQKKVTKEEALNRTPAPRASNAQHDNRSAGGQTRAAALSLLSLSPAPSIAPPARLTRGCTPCSRGTANTASLGRRNGSLHLVGCAEPSEPQHRCTIPLRRRPSDAVSLDEFGVQPTLSGVKGRCVALFTGTAARAQRLASARNGNGRFRAPLLAESGWLAVQRLSFGDFSLAQQRKVTRPPGRTPGTALASNLK